MHQHQMYSLLLQLLLYVSYSLLNHYLLYQYYRIHSILCHQYPLIPQEVTIEHHKYNYESQDHLKTEIPLTQ